jgi:hypothetical protein
LSGITIFGKLLRHKRVTESGQRLSAIWPLASSLKQVF